MTLRSTALTLGLLLFGNVAAAGPHDSAAKGAKKPQKGSSDEKGAPAAPPIRPLTLQEVFAAEQKGKQPVPAKDLTTYKNALDKLDEKDAARALDRADALYRLARLYVENERYYRWESLADGDNLQKLLAESNDQKEVDTARAKLKQSEESRKSWLKQATDRLVELTSNPAYADFRRMDQALVALATLQVAQGKDAEAAALVKRVVEKNAESQSLPDAYIAMAEAAFDKADYAQANELYKKVFDFPAATRWNYAHYRDGWSQLGLRDWKAAMDEFLRVAKMDPALGQTSVVLDETDPARQSASLLASEARRAIVWTYAQAGAGEKAWGFLRGVAGNDDTKAMELMELLASDYKKLDRRDQLADLYHSLVKSQSDIVKRCQWQAQVVQLHRGADGTDYSDGEAIGALSELVEIAYNVSMSEKSDERSEKVCNERVGTLMEPLVPVLTTLPASTDPAVIDTAVNMMGQYQRQLAPKSDVPSLTVVLGHLLTLQKKPCDAIASVMEVFRGQSVKATQTTAGGALIGAVLGEDAPKSATDPAVIRESAAVVAVNAWKQCAASSATAETKRGVSAAMLEDAAKLYITANASPKEARAFFDTLSAEQAPELEKSYKEQLKAAPPKAKDEKKGDAKDGKKDKKSK